MISHVFQWNEGRFLVMLWKTDYSNLSKSLTYIWNKLQDRVDIHYTINFKNLVVGEQLMFLQSYNYFDQINIINRDLCQVACNSTFYVQVFIQYTIYKQNCNLSAGWADATIQLQVMLQDATEFWSRVTLDQPGSSKQAWKKRLKVHKKLIHYQVTSSSHYPVQSCQRIGRCSRKLPHCARWLLLL